MRTASLVRWGLRLAGVVTWLSIATAVATTGATAAWTWPRWTAFAVADVGFLGLFLLYGGAVRSTARLHRLALALQSLCAAGIAGLSGRPVGFIFLVLVAAQMPRSVGPLTAVPWIATQTAVMGWVYARIVPAWEARAYIAVYLAFQTFAYLLIHAQVWLAEQSKSAERERIARELHDVLGHQLTVMSLKLEVARHVADEHARPHIEDAQRAARGLLNDVRQVVSELRELEAIDLDSALHALAQATTCPTVHVEVQPDLPALPPRSAAAMVRCAQEAITNAIKHSGARHLRLAVRRHAGGVQLEAEDDGRGAGAVVPGQGLRGMRERLQELGGRLEIDGAGAGFHLCAWLP